MEQISLGDCDLCAASSPRYDLTRICCGLRLIRSTPAHGARAAMWQHLAGTMDSEKFAELRAAAENAGMVRRKESPQTALIGP